MRNAHLSDALLNLSRTDRVRRLLPSVSVLEEDHRHRRRPLERSRMLMTGGPRPTHDECLTLPYTTPLSLNAIGRASSSTREGGLLVGIATGRRRHRRSTLSAQLGPETQKIHLSTVIRNPLVGFTCVGWLVAACDSPSL